MQRTLLTKVQKGNREAPRHPGAEDLILSPWAVWVAKRRIVAEIIYQSEESKEKILFENKEKNEPGGLSYGQQEVNVAP